MPHLTATKAVQAILRGMAEVLQKTGNMVLLDTYAQKTAQRLSVSAEAMRKEFTGFKPQPTFTRAEEDGPDDSILTGEAETEAPSRPSNLESHLLKLLFIHEELAPWLAAHLDLNWLAHPLVRQIVEARVAAHTQGTWQSLAVFLDAYESELQRSLITEAVADERKIPNPETQLADVTLKLRNQFLDQRLGELMHKISQPETSDAQKIEFLHEQQRLKQQKRSPLTPLEK